MKQNVKPIVMVIRVTPKEKVEMIRVHEKKRGNRNNQPSCDIKKDETRLTECTEDGMACPQQPVLKTINIEKEDTMLCHVSGHRSISNELLPDLEVYRSR